MSKKNGTLPPAGNKQNQQKPKVHRGGMPAGHRTQKTLDKETAREALRAIVLREMDRLVTAQVANAAGLKYLVTRDKKSGKFIRVTEAMARAKDLEEHEEIIEVWEKDPSVQAFTDLMNRAIDKPKEQEQEIKLTGEVNIVQRLAAGRARVAGR